MVIGLFISRYKAENLAAENLAENYFFRLYLALNFIPSLSL